PAGHHRAHRWHPPVRRGDDKGGVGSEQRRRGRECGCSGSVTCLSGPRKLACVADGAARPARRRQGGGADRGGDRTGGFPRAGCCGGTPAGGGAGIGGQSSDFGRVAVSGKGGAPRPPPLPTFPCAGRGPLGCAGGRAAPFTPASLNPVRANPRTSRSASRSCYPVIAPKRG